MEILITNYILGYFRSVDRILIVYDYATTDINSVLDAFEHVHPNLNFTIELANNNKMNYLHLTISRQCDTPEFSVFRKSAHADVIIPFGSSNPNEQKCAAVRYLVSRLDTS